MARGRTAVTLFATGALCASLAACGSSNKSSSTSSSSATATAAITKTEYLIKGNAICRKGDAKQNADVAAYAKAHHINLQTKPTRAQLIAIANRVAVPDIQLSINGVRALGAPSGDEQTVKAMVDASQQALDRIKQNPSLLFATRPFAAATRLLHSYGLIDCAKNA